MKTFMHNAESLLYHQFWGGRAYTRKQPCAALVPGYSHLYETGLQGNRNGRGSGIHRLSAFLYADVSRGDGTHPGDICTTCQCVSVARTIVESCVFSFQGNLSCMEGDGILASFGDVDSAMQCAINIQIALNKRNSCRKSARQVRYRIAVDIGEFRFARTEGDKQAIESITRLQRLASAGGIYVSRSARENLSDQSKISFVSLGQRYLPGCAQPVEALWIEMDRSQVLDVYQDAGNESSMVCS